MLSEAHLMSRDPCFKKHKCRIEYGNIYKIYSLTIKDISDTFALVQEKLKVKRYAITAGDPFSGKVYCGDCGKNYGRKTYHSTDKYRRLEYVCNYKYKNRIRCKTPIVTEKKLKEAFVKALNRLVAKQNGIMREYEQTAEKVLNTEKLNKEVEELKSLLTNLSNQMQEMTEKNSIITRNQLEFREAYDALVNKYEEVRLELEKKDAELEDKRIRAAAHKQFMESFNKLKGPCESFNEELFRALVERITIERGGIIKIKFKNGVVV